MDRDDGALDWDAAFDAIVAQLRPPRYQRVARACGEAMAAVVLVALACWMTLRLVSEPLSQLGRPWF